MIYRPRPVNVEAMELTRGNVEEVCEFIGAESGWPNLTGFSFRFEGGVVIAVGWGEFYVKDPSTGDRWLSPEEFNGRYERGEGADACED